MKKHTFFAIFSFLFITSACAPTASQEKISIVGTSPTSFVPMTSPTFPPALSPTWTPPPANVELVGEYKSKAPDHLALLGIWGKTSEVS